MPYINRTITKELLDMAASYPVVTLVGPRQSGKTTLLKTLFQNKPYISLEDPDIREFAKIDPRGFLDRFPEGAIFDEVQRQPELLSYIQTIVDNKNIKGMFLLTGSHQLLLQEKINQSLAGRTAILKLLPFSLEELAPIITDSSLDKCLLNGMYPRIYNDKINPTKFYRDYVQTYIERDVRQMINIKDLNLFKQFIKLCAGRVGQILNSNNLSNELGISYHTVNNWLSVLEASFLIFRLQPYYENFGKRILKSPKLYFTDVGLALYLLGITSELQSSRDPLRGALVENLIILELLKNRLNKGEEPNFYYYRDNNQNEVDLLIQNGSSIIAVEIKSSQTFNPAFLKGLCYFKEIAKSKYQSGYLLYTGNQEQKINDFQVLNYKHSTKIFDF